MHLGYSSGWLALAFLPALIAVPITQGASPTAETASTQSKAGLPFSKHDAVVGGTGVALGFIPAAIAMGAMAASHRRAMSNSQIRQLDREVVSGQQLVEHLATHVDIRVKHLGQIAEEHDRDLYQARQKLVDVGRDMTLLRSQGIRHVLAAHPDLWAGSWTASSIIPVSIWRHVVNQCRNKPGWSYDLILVEDSYIDAVEYAARLPASFSSSSSSSSSSTAPSPFAKAEVAASHWWAQNARATHRFVSHLHVPALLRGAAKVEQASAPRPVWARVPE
ncbi:MAG: hypothetical protein M1826_001305 [Phylliscum demangeonii]|nr:MAG: hypothetical protein M1826_001305 [Phylliscum demangeonii]